jgi:hypothetical protein
VASILGELGVVPPDFEVDLEVGKEGREWRDGNPGVPSLQTRLTPLVGHAVSSEFIHNRVKYVTRSFDPHALEASNSQHSQYV